jgi:hypothetical protein
MGARSSQSRGPGLNKTDGHLTEYFRNIFGAGGGAEPPPPPFSATGGTKFVDGSSTYHIFTGSGDFIGSGQNSTIEVLIVAGGGSGAGGQGGGAGGAGVVYGTSIPVGAATYPVVIGGGGASVTNPIDYPSIGSKGSVSSFNSVTAIGGGGGIENNNGYPNITAPEQALVIGANGGGGGGGSGPGSAADGITPQPVPGDYTAYGGYAGAPQAGAPGGSGGGGGGAGGASPGPSSPRSAGTASPGGAGAAFPSFPGPGIYDASPSPLQSTLTTSWRDALGPTGLFGGGGGGGEDGPSGRGLGGPGGGGDGGDVSNASTGGVDYTGGGGGGIGALGNVVPPYTSKGGDGIVIIAYPS